MNRASAIAAGLAMGVALGAGSCAPMQPPRDIGHDFSLRREKDSSTYSFTGYREVLLFHNHRVTDGPYQMSPTRRFVFFAAYENWYVFDSTTQRTRFLRAAPFECSAKFYEQAQPAVLRCFDVFNGKVIEMPLE